MAISLFQIGISSRSKRKMVFIGSMQIIVIPVSFSRKVHLKNGNVVGELTETKLDDVVESAMNRSNVELSLSKKNESVKEYTNHFH